MELLSDADRAYADRIAAVLGREVPGVFAPETVSRFVAESYVALVATSTASTYVPV